LPIHATDLMTNAASPPAHQFALLWQRRFGPFFWVQFLGAGNDNVFKFAVTVLVTYRLQVSWLPPAMAGLVIGALFILPFLLFSATSGQLADKYPKERLIRLVKDLEVLIMLLAAWGLARPDVPLLLACIFLMGLHSTLFGPVKYAYLPQHLSERELTGGNGLVEMGTFVAILLGNVAGGVLVAVPGSGPRYVAAACLGLALLGRVLAQAVPASPATDPALRINWNPFTETGRNLRLAHDDAVVFRSLLGISWMWFFGAVFLAQFPAFAHDVLRGDERVASLLLVVFSVGVGAGALLCEWLGGRRVEVGLVPLGAIGMTVFAVDLYLAVQALPSVGPGVQPLATFMAVPAHWRVLADLALLSLSAGLYSVPMYALIQVRSRPTHRARVIAANNILNALFMVASALIAGALLAAGLSIPEVFLAIGLANAVVACLLVVWVPEYVLRFVAWSTARLVYRLRVQGAERIPASGPAVLACNHVGAADALLLMAVSPRPIRLVVDHRAVRRPLLGGLLRLAGAIPVGTGDAAADAGAFAAAGGVLREGGLLGLFPEVAAPGDGCRRPFTDRVGHILAHARADGVGDVLVVPVALAMPGDAVRRRVDLRVGEPLPAGGASSQGLHEHVAALQDRHGQAPAHAASPHSKGRMR
jgi:1-acyl-sn-glycerol-3-phosphate acyltransferase/MFS family permease